MQLPRASIAIAVPGVAILLLALGCNSSGDPTAPPPILESAAVRYSGTIEIVAVDGTISSGSVRQSCGLSRSRGFVGRRFDFSVSFGDIPLLIPPGGRWGAELFGVPAFGCRMSYVRGSSSTSLSDLLISCSGALGSLAGAQIQTCNGSDGAFIDPRQITLPPHADGATAIQGPGRIEADMTFALGGGNLERASLTYSVQFDLRRLN